MRLSSRLHFGTRREFFREILYNDIAIIAIQHSKIYFVDTFGDFSHTVEWNSLKSVWQISLYILAETLRVGGSNYHTVWWKSPHSLLIFFVYINVAKFAISVWRFSPHWVVKIYSTNYKTIWKSIVWELLPYSVCRILPHA